MDRYYAPGHSLGHEEEDDVSFDQANIHRQHYHYPPPLEHHSHIGGYGTAPHASPYYQHYEPERMANDMKNPGLEYLSDACRQMHLDYAYGASPRPAELSVEAAVNPQLFDHAAARSMPPLASSLLYATKPDPPVVAPHGNWSSRRNPTHNFDLLLQASESAACMSTSEQSRSSRPLRVTDPFGVHVQDSRFGLKSQPRSSEIERETKPFPRHPLPFYDRPVSSVKNSSRMNNAATANRGQKRGGTFDDAESETGDIPPVRQQKTESNSPRLKKKPKTAKVIPGPTKLSQGGIFDDADENVVLASPTRSPGIRSPSETQAGTPSSVSNNQTTKINSVGPRPQRSRSTKLTKKKVNNAKEKVNEPTTKRAEDQEKESKKKKPTKPIKRILVARKEKELAYSQLAGKDDLLGIIEPKHCHFLGREFWIFTLQQLESVLRSHDRPENPSKSQVPQESAHVRSSLRSELLLHVAKSYPIEGQVAASKDSRAMSLPEGREWEHESNEEVPTEVNALDEPKQGKATAAKDPPLGCATLGTADSIKRPSKLGSHLKEITEEEVDPKAREEAETVLRAWEEKIEAWKNKDPKEREIPVEKMFPLDGPIACLFPTVIIRFFSSVSVHTLFDFLSLKKTETGAIIALCGAWRKVCGLVEGTPLALAKHFIGLGLRAETAIASVPPTDYRTRKWMGDPMIVLTGAAREYIVDARKISSGNVFVETRTKDLATGLMEWRASKGLPPLKGSGKVAMISGWKASVKEAIDLEEGEGKVLRDIDLQTLVEVAEEGPIVREERRVQSPTAKQRATHQEYTFDPRIPDVHDALHSPMFLKEVLDPQHFSVLQEAGVKTAVELFASQKEPGSPLALSVSKILPEPSTYQLVIFDWCQMVRKKLSGIRRANHSGKRKGDTLSGVPPQTKAKTESKTEKRKDGAGPKTKKVKPTKPKKEGNTTKPNEGNATKPKKCKATTPIKCKAAKLKHSKVAKPKEGSRTKPREASVSLPNEAVDAPRPRRQELLQKDIFYSLSAVTQTFLNSLGIATAEAFMHSRTTDLSNAFVEWRAKNDMTVLKGLGAIASVSGWKAQVRRLAKERGLEKLAQATPSGGGQISLSSKPNSSAEEIKDGKMNAAPNAAPKKAISQSKGPWGSKATSTGSKKMLSYPEILFGKPTKKLVVESSRDPRLRFYFQLSIRKKERGIGLFLSYLGARKLQTVYRDYARVEQPHVSMMGGENHFPNVSMPVAKDLSKKIKKDPNSTHAAGKEIRIPFSTLEDGCGLLELCRHDVWPLPCEGEVERVFPFIRSFMLGEDQRSLAMSYASNVTVGKDENGRSQYFLYLKKPLERGQTLEVRFCSPSPSTSFNAPVTGSWRQRVEEIVLRLSRLGLESLLEKICCFVSESVDGYLEKTANHAALGSTSVDEHVPASIVADIDAFEYPSGTQVGSTAQSLIVARRRAHWVASMVVRRLQDMKMKGGTTRPVGAEVSAAWQKVAWTSELVANLKKHPTWTDLTETTIRIEICDEIDETMENSSFLNAVSRERWCQLAKDLFQSLVERVKRFSGLLEESYSKESFVQDIRELCVAFSIKLKDALKGAPESLSNLLLTFVGSHDNRLDTSPSRRVVFQSSVSQTYVDALALCNESAVEMVPPAVQHVIVTSAIPGARATSPANSPAPPSKPKVATVSAKEAGNITPKEELAASQFRVLADVERGFARVDAAWYIGHQMVNILDSVLLCSSLLPVNRDPFKAIAMTEARAAIEAVAHLESRRPYLEGTAVALPCLVDSSEYIPRSLPLFLGLVWPALRSSHWRVEAGETPCDISFLPPGQRSRTKQGERHSKMQKQERTRSRVKLAKASNELGLGFVPKLTKRLFISSVVETKPRIGSGSGSNNRSPTVSTALADFLMKISNETSLDNTEGKNRAELVVDLFKTAFDELYPMLLSDDDKHREEAATWIHPSEHAGCEYLGQFLLVLPSILRQCQLSRQLVDDTMMVAKELASFLAFKHTELFDARFHPPKEHYVGEQTVPSSLASCLENLRSADSSKSLEITEAILPEDRPDVSDFIDVVMSQVVPCRASAEDVAKKNRRIGIGFVGLMCRHCSGEKEGRYFFTSIESMTTAATVIEKHIQKCTLIPPEIKAKMAECRGRHADQRKHLAPGAQAAYFLKLWERLRKSKVHDAAASLHMLQMTEKAENEENDDGSGSLEFSCHVRLLEYVRNVEPWSDNPNVQEGVKRYYDVLEYGGQVYGKEEMPKNFTSEWLLSRDISKPCDAVSGEIAGTKPAATGAKQASTGTKQGTGARKFITGTRLSSVGSKQAKSGSNHVSTCSKQASTWAKLPVAGTKRGSVGAKHASTGIKHHLTGNEEASTGNNMKTSIGTNQPCTSDEDVK